jgi:hypothetical protein
LILLERPISEIRENRGRSTQALFLHSQDPERTLMILRAALIVG